MSGNDAIALEELLGCSRELLEERFGTNGYRRLQEAVLQRAELLQRANARRSPNAKTSTSSDDSDDDTRDWRCDQETDPQPPHEHPAH